MKETLKSKLCRLADQLTKDNYKLTFEFPKHEMYALGDQIRRALISVPSNLNEGFSRGTDKHKCHYCRNAKGSLSEINYQMQLAKYLGYISKEEHKSFLIVSNELGKLLVTMIKILENRS